MIAECPKEGCDFSNIYTSEWRARAGLKNHIWQEHNEERIELYRKVEEELSGVKGPSAT